jgi:hypothetical protein
MATRRKAIRLFEHENRALKEMYLKRKIPSDQYAERPTELAELTAEFNKATGRGEVSDDIVHYMKNERKEGRWPKLGSDHKAKPKHSRELTADQIEVLVEIFNEHVVPLGHCSDFLSYDHEIKELIAMEFAHRTRKRVPSHVLVATLDALRKRGLLPKADERSSEDGGFSDIDDIAM